MSSDQIQSIIESFELSAEYFIWQGESATPDMDDDTRLQLYYESIILPDTIYGDEDYEKVLALMQHTGDNWDDADSAIGRDYKVFTDDEAQKEFDEGVELSVGCVMSEIPEHLRQYFDKDSYIADNYDDRGAQLNYYDGCEYTESVNGTTYYIYRQ